jgi:predicted aspartyl protease
MDLRNTRSFTITYPGITAKLLTRCRVCEAFNPLIGMEKHPKMEEFSAIWDTGATSSVITKNVADKLGLTPIGIIRVFHANGESYVNTYLVNIMLINDVGFHSLKVTEGVLRDMDVLIGMDIISLGDFAISNSDGHTQFTFQTPSTRKFDFVKEFNDQLYKPAIKDPIPGRNDPCHCGSGKKYKVCHGK